MSSMGASITKWSRKPWDHIGQKTGTNLAPEMQFFFLRNRDRDSLPERPAMSLILIDKLRREAARGSGDDGAECCYAPKWTCCDPKLLTEAADKIEELQRSLNCALPSMD